MLPFSPGKEVEGERRRVEFGDSEEGSGAEGDAESEGGEDREPPTHTRHRTRHTHCREDGES